MKSSIKHLCALVAFIACMGQLSRVAEAQDMFKVVPLGSWEYAAISELQEKKILLGYPNGYFTGSHVRDRYEFAVAIKRAIDMLPNNAGATDGSQSIAPAEVGNLLELTYNYAEELAQLGVDVPVMYGRLEALPHGAYREELFDVIPPGSWEYASVRDLQTMGSHSANPSRFHTRPLVLARYEFAVTVKRAADAALDKTGRYPSPKLSPAKVRLLLKATHSYAPELLILGTDTHAVYMRLEAFQHGGNEKGVSGK